ncbi:hypothetical protein PoB_002151900 [Plakobranchus ocellatus]|uniref:Secreted protein n=1 Tax=Plakobranchus ocellatus TaxID=259542 RepID=A0AAV3ZKW8_9GAST|nr:hypothetical protein PoB_002151900 [Plakobranchus ocellatus]
MKYSSICACFCRTARSSASGIPGPCGSFWLLSHAHSNFCSSCSVTLQTQTTLSDGFDSSAGSSYGSDCWCQGTWLTRLISFLGSLFF